jgi:hypothetical protein
MKRLVMDTNYWIALRKDPDLFKEFHEVSSSDNVEVYFSYGNFIDLAKAQEQDTMSKIIVSIADYCLPSTPTDGNKYRISRDLTSLIPDDDFRRFVVDQTQELVGLRHYNTSFVLRIGNLLTGFIIVLRNIVI